MATATPFGCALWLVVIPHAVNVRAARAAAAIERATGFDFIVRPFVGCVVKTCPEMGGGYARRCVVVAGDGGGALLRFGAPYSDV